MEVTLREPPEIAALVLRLVARRGEAVASVARAFGLSAPPRTEAERMDAIRAAALPPESCGPDMPAAPARGPVKAIQPMAMVRTEDGYDLRHTGFRGRDAARVSDVFDRMADQARRAGGYDPFTQRQKDAGRAYAALVERHSATGLKGRSIETMLAGRSGRGGDGIADIVLSEGRHIEAMRAAVGPGLALEVRRTRKQGRSSIRLMDLVDAVCLEGRTIVEVLVANGWAKYGDVVTETQVSLAAALDRMSDTR